MDQSKLHSYLALVLFSCQNQRHRNHSYVNVL